MLLKVLNTIRRRGFITALMISLSIFSYAFLCSPAISLMNPDGSCGYFLGLKFQDALSAGEVQYLGISKKKTFSLNDIKGKFFVIEVFSTYCATCPRDIPVINAVYSAVENDPVLKKNVRVFSIAIGNNRTEVEHYKKDQKILYPVLTDYNFAAHKALGNPRVPYTLIVRKTSRGRCTVEYSHQGILTSEDELLKRLKSSNP
jgi:thiol-disulfide isomerase/thioredoxin